MSSRISFAEFREANKSRSQFIGTPGVTWDLPRWGNALAGEVGEACNIIKKIDRGDVPLEYAREALAKEIADAFAYLDLMAECAGISLADAVVSKFNEISERHKLPHRLPLPGKRNPHLPDESEYSRGHALGVMHARDGVATMYATVTDMPQSERRLVHRGFLDGYVATAARK